MALIEYPAAGYDSFVDLATADAYMASVGYSDWSVLTDPVREAHLRRGTQFIYSRQIKPEFLNPDDGVHGNVMAATCEAAYLNFKGLLYKNSTGQVAIEKTVGPITIKYAAPQGDVVPTFPIIHDLLFGMTNTGTAFGPVAFERA